MQKAIVSHIKRNERMYLAFLLGVASLCLFCIGIKFMFNGAIDSSFGGFSGGFGMIALSFILAATMSRLFVKKKR